MGGIAVAERGLQFETYFSTQRHKASNLDAVKVATGTVVAGRIVLEGTALPEGSKVTVVFADDAETFELSPDDEAALLEAIREADDGALVSADDLLASLRRPA